MENKLDYLYSRSKYYSDEEIKKYINLHELLNERKSVKRIDPISVLSVIKKSYIIGDRTMIEGVKKTPWMHKYSSIEDNFEKLNLPKHGNIKLSSDNIALKFKALLLDEAKAFLLNKKTVGILLSGGMDSRVVAGIVRELQLKKEFNGNVVALTWGIKGTRDVVYAKNIAEKFQWEHVHYALNSDVLSRNIVLAADLGAEVSPLHLHAMEDISKEKGLDGVLGGSYGDSVGRGEFSGKCLEQLTGQLEHGYNKFGFLSKRISNKYNQNIVNDINNYRDMFPRETMWQQYEIEQQCHYMRRQLGSCMDIIDNNIPLYQMFTKPSVFGFIWSLAPECRNNFIYEELLKILPGELLNIPWARDGKIYPSKGALVDNLITSHNKYGDWLRGDCSEQVNQALNNGSLEQLNVFNSRSLKFWKKNWNKSSALKADKIDERISWLASLAIFCEKNNIQGIEEIEENNIRLNYESTKGILYGFAYRGARRVLK